MPVTCTVTPAITFTPSTNVTHAELNQAAQPQVAIPDGAITGAALNVPSVVAGLGEGASASNYFLNPNLAAVNWTRGTTAVSCPADTLTYRADDWWCRPAGAAVSYERAQSGPDTKSLHSAQLTGALSVTTVDFGQDIASHLATALAAPIVVSAYVYNGTGSSLAPLLRIDTADSLDDFSAVTNRYSTAASPAGATAQWTRHTWVLDATAFANMANGARVYLRMPSGSMDSGAKSVRLAQMKIERGTARTEFVVPVEAEEEDTETSGASPENFLYNPNFAGPFWRRPASDVALTSDTDVYAVDGWWAYDDGAGSAGIVRRSTTVPDTLSKYSLEIRGGSGVTAVRLGQNRSDDLAALCSRPMVFALSIHNATGASITPRLKIDTCDSANSWGAVTNRLNQPLSACPDGEWTRVTHAFDASALTNLANGFRIYVEIENGNMGTTGDIVRFAQAQFEPGLAASDWAPALVEQVDYRLVGSVFDNLAVTSAGGSGITVTADAIAVADDAGRVRIVRNLSQAVTWASTGLNALDTGSVSGTTMLALFCVSNGTTAGCLLSTSATAPTMPTGYTYKALIGFVRALSSSDHTTFRQRGRRVVLEAPVEVRAPATISTVTAVDLASYLPTRVHAAWGNLVNTHATVATNVSLGFVGHTEEATLVVPTTSGGCKLQWHATVSSSRVLTIIAASSTPSYGVHLAGYWLDL